jgi:hypothetical protein
VNLPLLGESSPIGRIFTYWAIVYLKFTSVCRICWQLFSTKTDTNVLIFTKKMDWATRFLKNTSGHPDLNRLNFKNDVPLNRPHYRAKQISLLARKSFGPKK